MWQETDFEFLLFHSLLLCEQDYYMSEYFALDVQIVNTKLEDQSMHVWKPLNWVLLASLNDDSWSLKNELINRRTLPVEDSIQYSILAVNMSSQ
mmetsp:Transcript_17637/g.43408  ORF Transcript_17637/g.43408 Transcript_17637/m.43408 type:complete len:94 (-) Transcript_17637:87-368(-)